MSKRGKSGRCPKGNVTCPICHGKKRKCLACGSTGRVSKKRAIELLRLKEEKQ